MRKVKRNKKEEKKIVCKAETKEERKIISEVETNDEGRREKDDN